VRRHRRLFRRQTAFIVRIMLSASIDWLSQSACLNDVRKSRLDFTFFETTQGVEDWIQIDDSLHGIKNLTQSFHQGYLHDIFPYMDRMLNGVCWFPSRSL